MQAVMYVFHIYAPASWIKTSGLVLLNNYDLYSACNIHSNGISHTQIVDTVVWNN